MMIRWTAGLVLLGCGLLPIQVSAQCAWVLWSAPPDATTSYAQATFTTRERCEERAEKENRAGGTVWLCLPDTIDPRGPKAKR